MGVVARPLAQSGRYQLFGYDVNPDTSAESAGILSIVDSPRALGEASDVLFVAVYDDSQVRDVLAGAQGLLSGKSRPRAVVILSTVSIDTVRWAGEQGLESHVDL